MAYRTHVRSVSDLHSVFGDRQCTKLGTLRNNARGSLGGNNTMGRSYLWLFVSLALMYCAAAASVQYT
jgi:hypothetical protein